MPALSFGLFSAPAQPIWWPPNTSFAADFTQQRYMRLGTQVPAATAFAFSRASSTFAQSTDGQWRLFPTDTPAITDRGVQLEPALTYQPLNSTLAGALSGRVGSEGALPTGWQIIASAGLSTRVEHVGTSGDLSYIRLALSGTSNATAWQLGFDNSVVAASKGEVWSASVLSRLVSTISTLAAPFIRCAEQDAATFLAATENEFAWTSSFVRGSVVRAFSEPTTTRANARFRIPLIAGATIDAVFDLALPTITTTGNAASPFLTTLSAQTRAADTMTLHLPAPPQTLQIGFEGGTTQTITGASGDYVISPATLLQTQVTSIVTNPS